MTTSLRDMPPDPFGPSGFWGLHRLSRIGVVLAVASYVGGVLYGALHLCGVA
jgi:hypothetical protein